MAQDTGISWAMMTLNPWSGCSKVSPGCKFCYAESLSDRFNSGSGKGSIGEWGPDGTRKVKSESGWIEPLKWDRWAAQGICYSCGGSGSKRTRVPSGDGTMNVVKHYECETCKGYGKFQSPYLSLVFCASLADIFENYGKQLVNVAGKPLWAGSQFYNEDPVIVNATWWDEKRYVREDGKDSPELRTFHVLFRLFELIRMTPNCMWLLLTKRPENIPAWLLETSRTMSGTEHDDTVHWIEDWRSGRKIPHNVALGTSVESQEYVSRIDDLVKVPSVLHWVSAEPLLGPLDLAGRIDKIGWAITGGESGKDQDVRPCDLGWVRDIRNQCRTAGVCFHHKQHGEFIADSGGSVRVGKKNAGRLLDGKIEDGFPKIFNMPKVIEGPAVKPKPVEPLPVGELSVVDIGGSD